MANKEEHEYLHDLEDNLRDADAMTGRHIFARYDITKAFEVMGATQMEDLWLHVTDDEERDITIGDIREILVQAHNFIVLP